MTTEAEELLSQKNKDKRLWIGNLDIRITEYQLLKLVQTYGDIVKFDLLFHRTGPQAGQSRGYAFVTYLKEADAISAKKSLNNMLVGHKRIIVAWAHSINDNEVPKPQQEVVIPALAMTRLPHNNDRESQITAIEAKLKLLEEKTTAELKINDTVATKTPVVTKYQQNKLQNKSKSKLLSSKKCSPYQSLGNKK